MNDPADRAMVDLRASLGMLVTESRALRTDLVANARQRRTETWINVGVVALLMFLLAFHIIAAYQQQRVIDNINRVVRGVDTCGEVRP